MLNINDIMTDGKLDGVKMYRLAMNSGYDSFLDDYLKYAEVINAHISSLKQETPITPELLERAGFRYAGNSYNTGRYESPDCFNFYIGSGKLWLDDSMDFKVQTMEQLSFVIESHTRKPLNWQHDPAAELRKRLEAMGFNCTGASQYLQDIGQLTFMVDIRNGKFSECFICGRRSTIETIDQLETVVKGMKSE